MLDPLNPEITYTIYMDVLWAINFLMDFALLWCTAKFSHQKYRWWRLLLAAMLGGFYGVGMVLPSLAVFYHPILVYVFPIFLLWLTFGRQHWRHFIRILIYFYLVSFASSGAILGSTAILQTATPWQGIGPLHSFFLLFGIGFAVFLAKYGIQYWQKISRQMYHTASLSLSWGQKQIHPNILLDTGNELSEPIQKQPVLVAEAALLSSLLPTELWQLYQMAIKENRSPIWLLSYAVKHHATAPWLPMLCFIPYCSVGVPNGQLLGIRTDQMQLILTTKEGNSYRLNGRITLAITPQTIHPQGAYHGILNPAILTELNHRAKPEIPVWNEIKKGA